MKGFLILLFTGLSFGIIFVSPNNSPAFQNEPDNFRGIKWGALLQDNQEMILSREMAGEKAYKREGDKLKIGEAEIGKLEYIYYKDKFYKVGILAQGIDNCNKIKDTLTQAYGEGSKSNPYIERYWWQGAEVSVHYEKNSVLKGCFVFYLYRPISEEKEKDEKTKAKEATKDL